jgi:hypothetical protein
VRCPTWWLGRIALVQRITSSRGRDAGPDLTEEVGCSRLLFSALGRLAGREQLVKLLFAAKVALCAPATRRELQGGDSFLVVLVRRLLVALITAALAVARLASRPLAS